MGTEQLEVSLNILLPLIHDISCFINVSFFFFLGPVQRRIIISLYFCSGGNMPFRF